jgi:hypothetical protein
LVAASVRSKRLGILVSASSIVVRAIVLPVKPIAWPAPDALQCAVAVARAKARDRLLLKQTSD